MQLVQYQHFQLECRKTEKDIYVIWIAQYTGCVVLQKTTQQEYMCFLNVLVESRITEAQISTSFNPIFAHTPFRNDYSIQLYTIRGLHMGRYTVYRETTYLEDSKWNCTKISIFEYDSGALIQSMFYQIKLDMQPATYHQYTLSKNVTYIVSTATFAFFRMIVFASERMFNLMVRLEAKDLFHADHARFYNIHYISLNVTQCQKDSPGMILVLSAKIATMEDPWFRDTYKFLDPAMTLPIVKIPLEYLDINLYYLMEEATTCIVNIDYRHYLLALSMNPNVPFIDRGACTFVVSVQIKLASIIRCGAISS